MEPKVNYTLVGLFAVVLGVAAIGVVVWLGKGDYTAEYGNYHVFMRESVSGLSVNSPVKYRGVEVGYVTDIRLNPRNPEEVQLTLAIVRNTPIKEDTLAVLHVQGLTGFAILDLTGGTKESPLLSAKPGEDYPVIQTGPSLFARLDHALSRLLEDRGLSRLFTNLNNLTHDAQTLLNEENRSALKHILADLATVSKMLAMHGETVSRGMTGAARTADNLTKLTATLNEQVPLLLERVNKSAAALQTMTEELARTSKTVGDVVNTTKPNIEQFTRETLTETGRLVAELRQLTATLNRVAQELEREPNALVLGRSPLPRGPGE